jgi:RND family efflux transporter MFP subunit
VNKKIVAAVVLVGVVILAIKGKSLLKERQNEVASAPTPSRSYISVEVVNPSSSSLASSKSFLAKLVADKSINLSTKLAGYIKKIYVSESQEVKKGQLLVSIDESEILSSIKALKSTLSMQEADVSVAKNTYMRNKKLYEIGGISKEMLDMSKVALEAKEAQVENTKQKIAQLYNQRKYLKITAPFDGVIDKIILHEGDLAATAKPIISMNDYKTKLIFSYAQNSNDIRKNQDVYYNSKKIGYIKKIYPTSTNSLTTAEVALDTKINQPLGSNININVVTAKANGCRVPITTLVHKKDGVYVMSYKHKKFTPFKVDIVLSNDSSVIITPCPTTPIAKATETKLSTLPAYENVKIVGAK